MDFAVCQTAGVFHVGDVVRKLRDRAGWSQTELGARADLNKDTIKRIEAGEKPRMESLEKIARALGTSVSNIYGQTTADSPELSRLVDDNEIADVVDIDIVTKYVKADIPVLGYAEATTAGLIVWSDEGIVRNQAERWISRPAWIQDKKAYALIVKGDSMEPRYFAGELVIASPNAKVLSGNFACVILKTGERMIKRVYRQQDGWNLISINDRYEPKFVRDEEVVAVHKIVHNSQDAISVAKEDVKRQLRTAKAPKGVRRFAQEHQPSVDADEPSGDDDDQRNGDES